MIFVIYRCERFIWMLYDSTFSKGWIWICDHSFIFWKWYLQQTMLLKIFTLQMMTWRRQMVQKTKDAVFQIVQNLRKLTKVFSLKIRNVLCHTNISLQTFRFTNTLVVKINNIHFIEICSFMWKWLWKLRK